MITDQEAGAAVETWNGLRKFWGDLLKQRLNGVALLRGMTLTDQEIVAKASALAWAFAAGEDVVHPHGARLDMMHLPRSQEKWRQACGAFQKLAGIDAQAALARAEAAMRNKDNAPELHVERR